jgi:hypothetical protein
MTPLAEIVDVGDLLNVVWTSLAAGVGVCIVFSIAILGFARSVDMRQEGNAIAMACYAVLTVVAVVAVLVLVTFGVVVMTSK